MITRPARSPATYRALARLLRRRDVGSREVEPLVDAGRLGRHDGGALAERVAAPALVQLPRVAVHPYGDHLVLEVALQVVLHLAVEAQLLNHLRTML